MRDDTSGIDKSPPADIQVRADNDIRRENRASADDRPIQALFGLLAAGVRFDVSSL